MLNLKQRKLLARWRERGWTYHGSESHADASLFRERMRAYGKPEREPEPVTTPGTLLRGRKGK
jgi:hypothetical protein